MFDPANPQRIITAVNLEPDFVTTYSFLAVDLKTGASWAHGGETGIPNHLPGFSTPTLRLYYDRRGGRTLTWTTSRSSLYRGFPRSFLSRPHSPCLIWAALSCCVEGQSLRWVTSICNPPIDTARSIGTMASTGKDSKLIFTCYASIAGLVGPRQQVGKGATFVIDDGHTRRLP